MDSFSLPTYCCGINVRVPMNIMSKSKVELVTVGILVCHTAFIIAMIAMMADNSTFRRNTCIFFSPFCTRAANSHFNKYRFFYTRRTEWIEKGQCKGGFQSYTCENLSGKQTYSDECKKVMSTTATLLSFAILSLFPSAVLTGLSLCVKSLNRYVGYVSFGFCAFGILMLMSGWAYIADNAHKCWTHVNEIRAAKSGSSCAGVIVVWFLYLPVLGFQYWLAKKQAAYLADSKEEMTACERWSLSYPFFRLGRGGVRGSSLLAGDHGSYEPPGASAPPAGACTAVALYDCKGDNDDELSFVKGDVLELIEREGEQWWVAKLNGRRGLVPANYVDDSEGL